MRLRFGSPSLSVLIFFAIIAGIVFYVWDNQPDPATNQPIGVLTEVAVQPTTPPTPTIVRNTVAPRPTAVPTQSIFNEAAFSDVVPDDTTIFIPRAGIYSRVIQAYLDGGSWDVSKLGRNVGHLEGTAWLNEPGNVVLSGHVEMADGRGGVFVDLADLNVGEVIQMQSGGEQYIYIVTEIYLTDPNDLQPIMPTTQRRLTLITCNDYDFFTNTYLERRIVIAEPL